MPNLQGALVVFLVFLIGVNCVDFENSTESGSETKQIAVGDLCSLKCGDDPYTYCDGDQDNYNTIKCVCPIKTQVYDAFRSKCITRCIKKCGSDSNTVCSGNQTTYESTICGCKDSINWTFDKLSRQCIRCGCKKGEKCTFNDSNQSIECKQCREGYTAVNKMCKGDCSNSLCKNGGSCKIKEEDITCDCPHPFYGEFCEKSAHCDPNPCKNGGTCRGVGDTFECVCPDVYGGMNCSENIFCEKYGHDYCGNASCYVSNYPTKVQCTCTDGQIFDKKSRTCTCGDGKVFDKISRTCIDDQCHPNPCKNGGNCYPADPLDPPYICICEGHYKGTNCTEKEKKGCEIFECGGGATCRYYEKTGIISCICPLYKYYDDVLRTCTDRCQPNPCVHGTCTNHGTYATCECSPYYFGDYCAEKVDDLCDGNPCLNGGLCTSFEYFFTCSCNPFYAGDKCEHVNLNMIAAAIVPAGLVGIGLVTIILFIRRRKQKQSMIWQRMEAPRDIQNAMPATR